MFTSAASIVAVVLFAVMFGGTIKLLITSLVNSLLPLARSLEVYSEGVEAKTRATVLRDVAKVEAECSKELKEINQSRAREGLPVVEFNPDDINWPTPPTSNKQ